MQSRNYDSSLTKVRMPRAENGSNCTSYLIQFNRGERANYSTCIKVRPQSNSIRFPGINIYASIVESLGGF